MLAFASTRRAVDATIGVQREMASHGPTLDGQRLRVRVGIHTGEALVDDQGDLFGQHVNMAARVGGAAGGGEVLLSSLARQIVDTRGDLRFGPSRRVELKGISGIHAVHPLLWADQD
jgi:class 3 adenylate cyclase